MKKAAGVNSLKEVVERFQTQGSTGQACLHSKSSITLQFHLILSRLKAWAEFLGAKRPLQITLSGSSTVRSLV